MNVEHQVWTVHTDGRDLVKRDIMARTGMMLEDHGLYYDDMFSYGRDDLHVELCGDYDEHEKLDALMQAVGFVWVDVLYMGDKYNGQVHVYSMKDLLWNVEHYGWKTSDWKGVTA